MAKKRTLICIHVMPSEIEMFERQMQLFKKAFLYLDDRDDVTLKVTLNLNPELTDWQSSEYKQDYFVSRFAVLFNGIKNINEIILDTQCWGTTQQKRESYKLDYDQFIFCDTDILFHEHMLRYQLDVSYQMDGMYIISPSLAKFWDESWDVLCHSDYMDKHIGYSTEREAIENTTVQKVESITIKRTPVIKFGCGMHTLYSKSFWEFVSIPDSFGGYGPEDTYAMSAASVAIKLGYDIVQVYMDGIYITEDYINRKPSFDGKIKSIDRKKEFWEAAYSQGPELVKKFAVDLIQKQSNS
jgi:hypothetical protein